MIVRPDSCIWPRSVLLLQPALLILLMGGARFAYRSWKEHRLYGLAAAQGEPVLVLGAGAAGARLVSELSRSDTWQVVALLDDNMTKVGARVHDTPVVGRLAQAEDVARRFGARHAIIAMPNTTHEARRRAVEIAASAGLSVLTVPSYDELLSEESPLAKLRAIELEDLLGRDPVVLDNPGLASWISGRTVLLVTGAGYILDDHMTGSIHLKPTKQRSATTILTCQGRSMRASARDPLFLLLRAIADTDLVLIPNCTTGY